MMDRIEEKWKKTVEENTPDMLEQLMTECGFAETDGNRINNANDGVPVPDDRKVIPYPAKRLAWPMIVRTAAAAAVLVISGTLLFNAGVRRGSQSQSGQMTAEAEVSSPDMKSAAIVSLDVNPSIEMKVNTNNKVTEVTALNEEGSDILSDMELAGTEIRVAAYALVGSMVTHGYLNEESNSVLVSVEADDPKRGEKLEKELSSDLNTFLENSAIGIAVFGQYVSGNPETDAFAKTNGISRGKAWIIKDLIAGDAQLTEASLLKLTTQELLLLWEQQKANAGEGSGAITNTERTSSSYGQVNKSKYIPKDEAVAGALAKAGLSAASAEGVRCTFDCEDGVIVYEVEFSAGGYKYEVEVNATTGGVMEFERQSQPGGNANLNTGAYAGRSADDDDLYDDADERDDRYDDTDDRYDDADDRYDDADDLYDSEDDGDDRSDDDYDDDNDDDYDVDDNDD